VDAVGKRKTARYVNANFEVPGVVRLTSYDFTSCHVNRSPNTVGYPG
jgi:hypothetical protein